jgi:hypothetical protein
MNPEGKSPIQVTDSVSVFGVISPPTGELK